MIYTTLFQNYMKKMKMINMYESVFIGFSTPNSIQLKPYVPSDYGCYVIYTTLIQKCMKKVKMINFNESTFIGLSSQMLSNENS